MLTITTVVFTTRTIIIRIIIMMMITFKNYCLPTANFEGFYFLRSFLVEKTVGGKKFVTAMLL